MAAMGADGRDRRSVAGGRRTAVERVDAISAVVSVRVYVLAGDGPWMSWNPDAASHGGGQVGDADAEHVRGGRAHAAFHDRAADSGAGQPAGAVRMGASGICERSDNTGQERVSERAGGVAAVGVLFSGVEFLCVEVE